MDDYVVWVWDKRGQLLDCQEFTTQYEAMAYVERWRLFGRPAGRCACGNCNQFVPAVRPSEVGSVKLISPWTAIDDLLSCGRLMN